MKHMLVLGASASLVPLIRAAKGLGAYVSVASIPGDYPGFAEGDAACCADITKPEEILALARRIGAEAVATCCMDVGLKAQGTVVSELGLPGPGLETVTRCTDKFLMKEAFLASGVRTPKSVRITSREELEAAAGALTWPLVTKAVDQMGSRGIYVCRTREALLENYERSMQFTQKPYCLVEEFQEGQLFGVEGMVKDGSIVFAIPDGTIAYPGFTPTPIGHYIPPEELMPYEASILQEVEKVVRALGIVNAPFNCDFILGKDGRPYCLEATARAGANCLPELIGLTYGVNYYEQIARLALGMPLSPALGEKGRGAACLSYTLHAERAGLLCDFDEETVRRKAAAGAYAAELADLTVLARRGETVRKYTNGRDGLGRVILSGPSTADCRQALGDILADLRMEVRPEEAIL